MPKNSKDETAQLKETMIKALEAFHGNVRNAALDAKISERTHYRWCREDNDYNNAIGSLLDIRMRHAKEQVLDAAMRKIESGDSRVLNKLLTIFYKNFTQYEQGHLNNFNDDPDEEEEDGA